jgi:DNA-binding NtrC family response regulator
MRTNDQVLVVDDDRAIRELVCAYLEKQGLSACGAADGREMRSVLQRFTPDVIVLDIMLPGEDGFALCRAAPHAHAPTHHAGYPGCGHARLRTMAGRHGRPPPSAPAPRRQPARSTTSTA